LRKRQPAALHTLLSVGRGFFDQGGDFFWVGEVDAVAGARDFYFVAVGAGGVPAFEVGIDGAVAAGYEIPSGFAVPRGGSNERFEVVAEVEDLGVGHECGLLGGEVGGEELVELRRVDVGKAVRGLFYRARFGEIAGEAFAVVGFGLASVWHVRGDVDKAGYGGMDATSVITAPP
jgi:hypothetical protein